MPGTWRILAVAYRMPPLLTPRSIQVHRLLSHWARVGHDVHAICAAPDTAPCPAHDDGLMRTGDDGYRLHQVPSPEASHIARFRRLFPKRDWRRRTALQLWGKCLSVPDPQRFWVRPAARTVCHLIRREAPDVLITFGNPMSDHLIGCIARRSTGVRWLAHFSDPWVDNPYRPLTPLLGTLNRRLERRVVAQADHTIFVSDATRRLVMDKYPASWRRRSRTIPHYFDGADLPSAEASAERMVFRHLGTFYGHRTPEPLFAAIQKLKQSEPGLLRGVDFELIGPIYPPKLMEDWLEAFDLPDSVRSVSPVPYHESLSLMSTAHVLVSFDADVDGANVFLPSKLIDYLGANRPLFGITPSVGPSADLVRRAGGPVADPKDIDGIADAIATLIREFRDGTLFGRHTPPSGVRKAYEVSAVAPMFEALFSPDSEVGT